MSAVVPGVLSSVVTCTLFYPLELIETLLQARAGCPSGVNNGLSLTCRTVYQTQGIPGFYRGLEASAAGTLAYYGCYFQTNHYLESRFPSQSTAAVAGKSWASAACACLCTTPLLVWRTRSMIHPKPLQSLVEEVRAKGPRALYSGLVPNVLGTCSTALWFTSHHSLKMHVSGGNPKTVSPTMAGLLGTVSTALSASITYPLSVLRTKLMVGHQAEGMAATARAILRTAGPSGFYYGFTAYLLRTIPKGATFFAIQKTLEDLLNHPVVQPMAIVDA